MAKCKGSKKKRAAKRARAQMLLKRWWRIWESGCDRCERVDGNADGRQVTRHCSGCNRELVLIAVAAKLPKVLKRKAA